MGPQHAEAQATCCASSISCTEASFLGVWVCAKVSRTCRDNVARRRHATDIDRCDFHAPSAIRQEDGMLPLQAALVWTLQTRERTLSHLCCHLPVLQADTYITAFRRWIASFGGGGPFGDVTQPNYLEQIGARQSREQLLDRWGLGYMQCCRVAVVVAVAVARAVIKVKQQPGQSGHVGAVAPEVPASFCRQASPQGCFSSISSKFLLLVVRCR